MTKQLIKSDKHLISFQLPKNSDGTKQLESRTPIGNWCHFDLMDVQATEIIQAWNDVSTGQHISVHHFCPCGMKETMKKKLTADNSKFALILYLQWYKIISL